MFSRCHELLDSYSHRADTPAVVEPLVVGWAREKQSEEHHFRAGVGTDRRGLAALASEADGPEAPAMGPPTLFLG